MVQLIRARTALLAGLLITIICSVPLSAQQSATTIASQSALAVSPAIIESIITPGSPTAFTVEVRNITNFPLPIKTFVRGLTPEEHTSNLSYDEQARLDASKWFTVQDPDFILQPNQTRTVIGIVEPPADAEPGGHYATIFFQPLLPEQVLSPAMAYVNARVGVLSFLIVQGDIKQQAELKSGLQTNKLVQNGPITFTFTLHNTGNTHLLPASTVTIYNLWGAKVAAVDVPHGAILPNTSRDYSVEWDGPPVIGGYKAELSTIYGAENIPLPKTAATFWVVPGVGLLIGVVIVALTLFFVIKTHHRWRRAWLEVSGRKMRLGK